MQTLPHIHVIFTGGTISMTQGSQGTVPTLSGADIFAAVPELQQKFQLTLTDFGRFPGPHMTLERMLELHKYVQQAIAQGAQGIVITHGTDTLEETAYLLDLLHHFAVPIVIVGAMRTMNDLSWDGPVNLYAACLVAAHPDARNRGVMVVLNNTIHAACEVSKIYTEAVDTFVSDKGPLGIVDEEQIFFYRAPVRRLTLGNAVLPPARVEVLMATSGSDGTLVHAAIASGSKGLVIAGMGRGNVPPLMAQALAQAIQEKVAVVICSRCFGGRVAPIYGYEGGGAQLQQQGAIFAPWLNAQKARLLLSLALAQKITHEQLQKLFT